MIEEMESRGRILSLVAMALILGGVLGGAGVLWNQVTAGDDEGRHLEVHRADDPERVGVALPTEPVRRDAPTLANALDRAAAEAHATVPEGPGLNASIGVLQRETRAASSSAFSSVTVQGHVLWEGTLLKVRLVTP